MSHFTVLVAAKDGQELDEKLLPYHEYESTGDERYTEFVPEDMELLTEDFKQHGEGRTLEEFAADWNGARKNADGVYGRLTNPNAKWDWWSIGGRWSGLLILKPEARGNGHNGEGSAYSPANSDPARADVALAGEVDWEAMRQVKIELARQRYQRWHKLRDPEASGDDVYREALKDREFLLLTKTEFAQLENWTEDQYVEAHGRCDALTFAYIDLDGKWHESARMGWFGVTYEPNDSYDAGWWQFVQSLPADQRVYVIDCHI